MLNSARIKSTGIGDVLKLQVAAIAKSRLGRIEAGRLDLRFCPLVLVCYFRSNSVRDQEVFVTVQVNIEKHGAPGPIRSRHTAEVGDFRVSSIAPVPEERVAGHVFEV